MNKYEILKEVFGHTGFRGGQAEIIDSLSGGRDVLAVMPTGGGKSICYQIPALMSSGITLVVSPLISLMKDQVMSLVQTGVRAAYINSSLTYNQYLKVIANMRLGVYKIIYLAPERLMSDDFLSCCAELDISLIAVDEAHCVSGWGQDFRPAYLGIRNFIASLPKRPTVGAFTATATDRVREDIKNLLGLEAPFEITTGFDRPNLYFEVIPTKKNTKSNELLRLLRERYAEKSGIIYCGTRACVEEVAAMLNSNGFDALAYHAGMDDAARHTAQDDFIYDKCRIMVATNAFGMGIDKSNVSFVIHYNMPKDVESYYQEAGRAGRDGEKAECVMLWSDSDIVLNRFLIEKSEPVPGISAEESENLRRLELLRLDKMVDYCRTLGCLRAFLLRYFGEDVREENCGNCSNCNGDFDIRDVTEDAKKILSCIARTNNTYGGTTIAAILTGSMNEQIEKKDLDSLSTYGIMKGSSTLAPR
ncbi:MAG: RecQ family ATP-dependent DNA helicase, partial [Eubacteriales bacterium]